MVETQVLANIILLMPTSKKMGRAVLSNKATIRTDVCNDTVEFAEPCIKITKGLQRPLGNSIVVEVLLKEVPPSR